MQTTLAIDTNAYIHRAWHSREHQEKQTAGAYSIQFREYIESGIKAAKPTHVLAVKDMGGKTFRHDLLKSYKAHREKKFDIKRYMKLAEQVYKNMGIDTIGIQGLEGDDIFGLLVKHKPPKNKLVCMTADKDISQLTQYTNVYTMNIPYSYDEQVEMLGAAKINKIYGFHPNRIALYLALMGDAADNIPGIPGIGKVRAQYICSKVKDIDDLYTNINNIGLNKTIRNKLIQHKQDLYNYLECTVIALDRPEFDEVKITWNNYLYTGAKTIEPPSKPELVTETTILDEKPWLLNL